MSEFEDNGRTKTLREIEEAIGLWEDVYLKEWKDDGNVGIPSVYLDLINARKSLMTILEGGSKVPYYDSATLKNRENANKNILKCPYCKCATVEMEDILHDNHPMKQAVHFTKAGKRRRFSLFHSVPTNRDYFICTKCGKERRGEEWIVVK